MAYQYKNSRGNTYYLHSRDTGKDGKGKLYFFAKEQKEEGGVKDLPKGYTIVESEKTGLPILKKA